MSYNPPLCPHCGGEPVLYREINSNGAEVITARCYRCNRFVNSKQMYLPKAEHPNWQKYPLYRDLTANSHPCSVNGCGRKDTELHHFAPRYLFDNADDWVTDWLCSFHHREWHERTRTGSYDERRVELKRIKNANR